MRSRAIVLHRHGPREVCSGNDDAISKLVRIADAATLEGVARKTNATYFRRQTPHWADVAVFNAFDCAAQK